MLDDKKNLKRENTRRNGVIINSRSGVILCIE